MNKKTLLLFSAFLLPGAAHSATHLGTASSAALVTLFSAYSDTNPCGGSSFANRAFFRMRPDGTQSATPFVIPADKKLVITDVKWSAYGGGQLTALTQGRSLTLGIYLLTPGGQYPYPVFSSAPITLSADDITGRPGGAEHLTAGFVVGPNVSICPSASQSSPSWYAVANVDQVVLQGYLTQ